MNDFTNCISSPFTLSRSVVLAMMLSTIIGMGCASRADRIRGDLQARFQELKTALEQGDLKSLQEIWISPDGRTFSLETLSSYYERNGGQLVKSIQQAKLMKTPNVFTPPTPLRRKHPNAKYAGILRVRNSFGAPRPIHAIMVNGSWRLLHNIQEQQTSTRNDSGKQAN